MSKTLRVSEQWYRRALWLVAFIFAWFLIGLGGIVVNDLPKVERSLTIEQFMDPAQAEGLKNQLQGFQDKADSLRQTLEQARLTHQQRESDTRAEQATLQDWLNTRSTTQTAKNDPELLARTQRLEQLRSTEREALQTLQTAQSDLLALTQSRQAVQTQLDELTQAAQAQYNKASDAQSLRVFGYRLLLTLPLLALALWLLLKKRHSQYWPFVWGYGFFAGFVFFVELVPYLPSYGGYVRYVVGVLLTVLVGRYAIVGMNRYLEQQKKAEAVPEQARRAQLDYDQALVRLGKSICPGCERPVNLQDTSIDFCAHCGIGLFHKCGACGTRKSCFGRYCHACGTPQQASATTLTTNSPPTHG